MNKAQQRYSAQYQHGERLKALFRLFASTDSLELYNKLHRIEARAHNYAERVCNGDIEPTDEQDAAHDASILRSVRKILGYADIPIIINGDPRGYALKIPDKWVREHKANIYTDMGGYGIICPDF